MPEKADSPAQSRDAALPNRPDADSQAVLAELMEARTETDLDLDALEKIHRRAFAQMQYMIWTANYERESRPGDPKVGGHPASCASSLHVLGALHLVVREPHDYVCCKPHASPVDHTFHHLMRFFKTESGTWLDDEQAKRAMYRLRDFPNDPAASDDPDDVVFQSYHARTDPDSFHFLPSGSVGIPQVVSVYLALAHRYAKDHRWVVPRAAHFWSLMGDSEFREGSVLECMPDVSERRLGNVTWIVDYNRQNLDGTRIPNDRSLRGSDADRIERTALANGWDVIQVRHGRFREDVFARPGGERLRDVFEKQLSDYELQMLLLAKDGAGLRRVCLEKQPETAALLEALDDDDMVRLLFDFGGHDVERMVAALRRSKEKDYRPCLVIAHTIKGWNLECAADPANHSTLPGKAEIERILADAGLDRDDPFALFDDDTPEGAWLARRRDAFRAAVGAHQRLRAENRAWIREAIERDGGIPEALGIDLSMFPRVHTQWMWGQLASKLVRIGTADEGGPQTATSKGDLTQHEEHWKTAADFVLTLSPDVGTSTNISPLMDERVYGPGIDQADLEQELHVHYKHPQLVTKTDVWTRHIRFEIAEANCMSAVGAFGKMAHYTGLPFFPMMTVYDFFIKRALDQLFYDLYWGAEFVLIGTPSGVNLSSEGAQHSWKSDIQIPNLITWEPMFALELDWILSDAIRRHMEDTNEGRRGVLIRCVTRAISQKQLLDNLRTHANCKNEQALAGRPLKPADGGPEWGPDAVDESTVPADTDENLLSRVRKKCLAGGYRLVDWRGYAGYEPGDNVVNVFSMGSVTTEAVRASYILLERGIFANVICVTSPELLLGILGEEDDYRHLREGLGLTGNLYAVPARVESHGELVTISGRRVPVVALCDGEAGLLDNIGSIVGVKQRTLAVRKFAKCGRPDQAFTYQHLDADAVVEACGRVLAETAFEDLRVSRNALARLSGEDPVKRPDWRELWPELGSG